MGRADCQKGGASEPESAPGRQESKLSYLDSLRSAPYGMHVWSEWQTHARSGLKTLERGGVQIEGINKYYTRIIRNVLSKRENKEQTANNDQLRDKLTKDCFGKRTYL